MREPDRLQAWTAEATLGESVRNVDLFGSDSVGGWNGAKAVIPVRGSQAVTGVYGRLGLHYGDRVRIVGPTNTEIASGLGEAVGRQPCLDHELADVVLYWPLNRLALERTLPSITMAVRPGGAIWVITAHPGKIGAAGPAIPQSEVLETARRAGLRDNKVTVLGCSEYGYRFTVQPAVVH